MEEARQKDGRCLGLGGRVRRSRNAPSRVQLRHSPECDPEWPGTGLLNEDGLDKHRFEPDGFFPQAAARLYREAPAGPDVGDHLLNPQDAAPGRVFRDAAVLIPVVAHPSGVTALLTLRTPNLAVHASQIAFPGGKMDPDDAGPAAAALREAREEIGLAPDRVDVVGYLDPYLTGTGYRVVPVVGRVAPNPQLSLNPHEVQEAFEVPLSFLMTPANHKRGSRVFQGRERHFYEMPFEGRYIWGITAGIIRGFYERVFG